MSRKKVVILTGAGISAESGIPTYRDSDGLWNEHPVEEVATARAIQEQPLRVFSFLEEMRERVKSCSPNRAHVALAKMEHDFDVVVITQNVDDLHERAGSSNVIHLHGRVDRFRDAEGNLFHTFGRALESAHQPLRHDIVLFGEDVPKMPEAAMEFSSADAVLVLGTSLSVYPAASLIDHIQPRVPILVVTKELSDDFSLPGYATVIDGLSLSEDCDEWVDDAYGIINQ